MVKNINCAAMGYECVFAITAEADQQDLMVETVERHAAQSHPELVGSDATLKPEVRQKLLDLLTQSKYLEP